MVLVKANQWAKHGVRHNTHIGKDMMHCWRLCSLSEYGIKLPILRLHICRFWQIPGCEDIPYVQTWLQVLKKRAFLAIVWILGAAIVAGIIVLIFGLAGIYK